MSLYDQEADPRYNKRRPEWYEIVIDILAWLCIFLGVWYLWSIF